MGYTTLFSLDRLDEIALNVFHGKRGSFLKAFADTWLRADNSNKLILRSVWKELIHKYDLKDDPAGTGVSKVVET